MIISDSDKNKAVQIVSQWMRGAPREKWNEQEWPSEHLACRLGELHKLGISTRDAQNIFTILLDECGMREAIRVHGLHEIWAADVARKNTAKPMARFFFEKIPDLVPFFFDEGICAPQDSAYGGSPKPTVLTDAAKMAPPFAKWLLERGLDLKSCAADWYQSIDEWNPNIEEFSNLAHQCGLDPWQPNENGGYPILKALSYNIDDYAVWLLDRLNIRLDTAALGFMVHIAKEKRCEKAEQRLSQAYMCESEKRALETVHTESLARIGELAKHMIELGMLNLDGKAPKSAEDFVAQALRLQQQRTPRSL